MRLGLEAGAETLDLAVELDISGVPIMGTSLVEQGVNATLTPLREKELLPCQIGMFGYNPLADDESNELLSKVIPLAQETGCRYITIGPGNYHASGFGHYDERNFQKDAIRTYAKSIDPMINLAEKYDVVLTIEAYLKGVIRSAETFNSLHEVVTSDHLRCNIDPSSLYSGLHDYLDPMPLVRNTIQGLVGYVGLVHLKEVAVEEGFHLKMGLSPIGSGKTDWSELLKCVQPHLPEDGWVVVEHCMSPDEARESVGLIRAAAVNAGIRLT